MAALAAYRHLLRATRVAFDGDTRVLTAARQQIRDSFSANAQLGASDVPAAVGQAEEIAQFLRQNVVQGKKDGDAYKLRIHEEIERGDNDTVRLSGGRTLKIDGKTCRDR